MKITAEQVWEATQKDLAFMSKIQFESQMELIKSFIENHLIDALAEHLDNKVTVETWCRASMAYTKAALEHSLISDSLRAIPEEARSLLPLPLEEAISSLEELLQEALDNEDEFITEMLASISSGEMKEEQSFLSAGVSFKNLLKIKEGNLTIGELLLSQPSTIICGK